MTKAPTEAADQSSGPKQSVVKARLNAPGGEPPKNERSLKHQLEASRVPEAGIEPARL